MIDINKLPQNDAPYIVGIILLTLLGIASIYGICSEVSVHGADLLPIHGHMLGITQFNR